MSKEWVQNCQWLDNQLCLEYDFKEKAQFMMATSDEGWIHQITDFKDLLLSLIRTVLKVSSKLTKLFHT